MMAMEFLSMVDFFNSLRLIHFRMPLVIRMPTTKIIMAQTTLRTVTG